MKIREKISKKYRYSKDLGGVKTICFNSDGDRCVREYNKQKEVVACKLRISNELKSILNKGIVYYNTDETGGGGCELHFYNPSHYSPTADSSHWNTHWSYMGNDYYRGIAFFSDGKCLGWELKPMLDGLDLSVQYFEDAGLPDELENFIKKYNFKEIKNK